jgi:hypothetical protein
LRTLQPIITRFSISLFLCIKLQIKTKNKLLYQSAIYLIQMPVPNTSNNRKLQENLKIREIYLRASSWIRDMSVPRAPARLPKNHGTRAAGGGPSK